MPPGPTVEPKSDSSGGLKVETGCQLLRARVFKGNLQHQAAGAKRRLRRHAIVRSLVDLERDVCRFVRLSSKCRPAVAQGLEPFLVRLLRQILDDQRLRVSGTVDLLRQIRQNPEVTADDVVALLGDEEPIAHPCGGDECDGHRESGNP